MLKEQKDSKKKLTLLDPSRHYKDRREIYQQFYEAWDKQQKLHWISDEVSMSDDMNDWKFKITDKEKNLITQILRFFTQADIDVNNCYMNHYSRVFKVTEVQMMISAFSNIETIHIDGYAKLIDSLNMPDVEHSAFMKYSQMRDKHEYMQQFNVDNNFEIASTLAAFGAFTEGLQLFASFVMLLNFPRFNKMKGMGQIVSWSLRDETLHTESIIKLYHQFLSEFPEINNKKLHDRIYKICRDVVKIEDAFIDLAFEMGGIEGLSAADVKRYIRYIADIRLVQLRLEPIYGENENPLPWLHHILNGLEFSNFFEQRPTEYSKGSTTGEWNDVFTDWNRVINSREEYNKAKYKDHK